MGPMLRKTILEVHLPTYLLLLLNKGELLIVESYVAITSDPHGGSKTLVAKGSWVQET